MDPRGNPSGGDWSLERSGAIFIENTDNVSPRLHSLPFTAPFGFNVRFGRQSGFNFRFSVH